MINLRPRRSQQCAQITMVENKPSGIYHKAFPPTFPAHHKGCFYLLFAEQVIESCLQTSLGCLWVIFPITALCHFLRRQVFLPAHQSAMLSMPCCAVSTWAWYKYRIQSKKGTPVGPPPSLPGTQAAVRSLLSLQA